MALACFRWSPCAAGLESEVREPYGDSNVAGGEDRGGADMLYMLVTRWDRLRFWGAVLIACSNWGLATVWVSKVQLTSPPPATIPLLRPGRTAHTLEERVDAVILAQGRIQVLYPCGRQGRVARDHLGQFGQDVFANVPVG